MPPASWRQHAVHHKAPPASAPSDADGLLPGAHPQVARAQAVAGEDDAPPEGTELQRGEGDEPIKLALAPAGPGNGGGGGGAAGAAAAAAKARPKAAVPLFGDDDGEWRAPSPARRSGACPAPDVDSQARL